jgi:hypothetical protein
VNGPRGILPLLPATLVAFTLGLADPAVGQGQVTLRASDWPAPPPGPYAWANLTVANASDQPIRQALLRWDQGGPLYRVPLTVAPGGKQHVQLLLPAAWAQQQFLVRLAGPESPGRPVPVPLAWPEDVRGLETLPNEQAYDPYQGDLPGWSQNLRRRVWIGMALAALAVLAAQSAPRKWLRLVGTMTATAGLCLYLGLAVLRAPAVAEPTVLRPGVWEAFDGTKRPIVVLTTRRSAEYRADRLLLPLYRNFGQLRDDQTVIDWPAQTTLPIQPDQLRIFQTVQPTTETGS